MIDAAFQNGYDGVSDFAGAYPGGALFASVAGKGLTDLRVQESEESEMVRQKRNELERPTLPKIVHSL